MILVGTGHRPPRLGLSYTNEDRGRLTAFLTKHLSMIDGVSHIISGMAQGFDQSLAEAAIALNIPFVAALPFEGMESRWPTNAQDHFKYLCGLAEKVVIVSEGGPSSYKYIERDRWMVDRADKVIALWDGVEKGGTWATVDYAQSKNIEVVNLWEPYNACRL